MRHFIATIKLINQDHLYEPEYYGNITRREVEDFFGCHEPDVEWFRIREV